MNKFSYFVKNIVNKIKSSFISLYRRSYGMDDLNKGLMLLYLVLSIVNLFVKNNILYYVSLIFFIILVFRYFSSNKISRAEENRNYRKFIKYIKLKYEYRNTHRIYLCKNCKQIIRLPKGKGKVEVTCPTCGYKHIYRI